MSCRNLLGMPERRSVFPDGPETESGITCIDPGGGGWFGRMAEQLPLQTDTARMLPRLPTTLNARWPFFKCHFWPQRRCIKGELRIHGRDLYRMYTDMHASLSR